MVLLGRWSGVAVATGTVKPAWAARTDGLKLAGALGVEKSSRA
jgi:hypothetical protein